MNSPALVSATGLPTIGLDELVARAARQTRVDRKYVLAVADADRFVAQLGRCDGAQVLAIEGRRDSGYASLYLDTPELTGYHLAARGRRRRFKVRHRTYLDSGDSYVEVKTRGVRGTTVKQRVPHDGLPATVVRFVDGVLGAAQLGDGGGRRLRPVLTTGYRRTTLYLPASEDRVTVDTDLTWALPGGVAVTLPGLAVVETKTGAGASTADRRLWRAGQRPVRISKYATGLAALRGDLPDNRWRPVLRRHFGALTPSTQHSLSDRVPGCPNDRIPA